MIQQLSVFGPVLSQATELILIFFLFSFFLFPNPAAPPAYSSVVTEEEAEQRSSAAVPQPAEDLSGILERPLMAFVQEFRYRPPPVYSEVSLWKQL